ncbi:transcriptional activator RfaH [Alphaproteobacteria bacterium]|nr:transcriptional activator RfaH [Alphaproteobacteria bacterium]
MDWYAVQTQPNRENLALEHLKRQGFSVWMPLCERIIRHARKSKRVRRPLFPGYLFVNLDFETAQWRSINGTIGANRIVSFGQRPAPVATQFIDALQNIEANEGLVAVNGDDLLPGQDVEILSGTMAGTIAKLLSLEAGDRVTILLNMLGHFVRGQILREHVASI